MSAIGRSAERESAREGALVYCVIAYHFPPDTSAGAVRAHGLARALAGAGNEVHVFTPAGGPDAAEGYTVHVVPGGRVGDGLKHALGVPAGGSLRSRVPGRASRVAGRILRLGRAWLLYPDAARAWARTCADEVDAWSRTARPDVLISSAPPWSAHVAAWRVRRRAPRPVWIADWRDLWTVSPHYDLGDLRRWFDRRLECRLLRGADAVTVTTGDMAARLAEAYPDVRPLPVYNGYDERHTGRSRVRVAGDRPLTITYAGYLYEGKRSVVPLLEAVFRLIADGRVDRARLRLRFASPPDAALTEGVARLGLHDVVELVGVVPRSEVPRLLEDSDVLLVVMWDAVLEADLVPAKTFEYLQARRLVLALRCAPDSELGRLLEGTRTGVCVRSDEGIDAALTSLYDAYVTDGVVGTDPDLEALGSYTHERMAARFDEIARSLVVEARAHG